VFRVSPPPCNPYDVATVGLPGLAWKALSATEMTQVMVQLRGVGRTYPGAQPFHALSEVTLDFFAGQSCALIGPSGSGKSTLMNLIGLLDRPTQGRLFLDGRDLASISQTEAAQIRNREIGFVFQAFHLLPRLEAWENVALPLVYRGAARPEQHERAIEALGRVGLADRARNRPSELSGGQRQRVAIARALVGTPRILLADEPTGSLDSLAAAEVIGLFDSLVADLGVTLIMVTHDPSVADRCQRQVALLDGRVVRDSARAA